MAVHVHSKLEYEYTSMFSVAGGRGGAMVLGKLPVRGRPTTSEDSRARAYCACGR